jgi:hypothetical protein
MVSVTLSLIVFLALIVWRLVFADPQRRPLVREMAARQGENNLLNRVGMAVIAGDRFEHGSQGVDPFERKNQAKTYLRHIVALTGSAQTCNDYVLDVGTTRFYVRYRYVRRLRDVRDPKCEYEETCFCLPYKIVPKAERIATALLQLRNNPVLFDRWAAQIGAVKAAGQVFTYGH